MSAKTAKKTKHELGMCPPEKRPNCRWCSEDGKAVYAAPVVAIKERPIIFSAPMVRAILEGRKTQTRRAINAVGIEKGSDHTLCWPMDNSFGRHNNNRYGVMWLASKSKWIGPEKQFHLFAACPYGQPGGRLWVRESFYAGPGEEDFHTRFLGYVADGDHPHGRDYMVKPSIHMPRWASRILLEIMDIRVQRIQEISEEDAIAEGIDLRELHPEIDTVVDHYRGLWNYINGLNGPKSWANNPWVWAISFKRIAE
jgi:hypothetical protein